MKKTHGVDFARVIQPMKALNGYKGFKTDIYDPKIEQKHNDPKDWISVMKENQIFYFNYINNPWGFAAMGVIARKEGVKLIMDMDDDLWDVHKDNPAYNVYHKGSPDLGNFTSICNEVDYITCTNDYLKHVIMNHTNKTPDKIKVFPNYIDLNLYKHRSPFKNDGQIVLAHFGSGTHYEDLKDWEFLKGVDRIMKEYPNVIFRSIGSFIPVMRQKWGPRYEEAFGAEDIYEWINNKFPDFMDQIDIMIVPLVEDIYNKCKSNIKWLEASSAKKPGVWQDIRQYSEVIDGTNGLLATKDTQWYRGIKTLIDDPIKRKAMGEKAFKDIEKDWTMQGHIDDYLDFFEKIV